MKQLELFNLEFTGYKRYPIEPENETDTIYAQQHYMLLNLVGQNAIHIYYNEKQLTANELTDVLFKKVENQTEFRDNRLLSQFKRILIEV